MYISAELVRCTCTCTCTCRLHWNYIYMYLRHAVYVCNMIEYGMGTEDSVQSGYGSCVSWIVSVHLAILLQWTTIQQVSNLHPVTFGSRSAYNVLVMNAHTHTHTCTCNYSTVYMLKIFSAFVLSVHPSTHPWTIHLGTLINPQHACAAMVTVVCWPNFCVCVSSCYHASEGIARCYAENEIHVRTALL